MIQRLTEYDLLRLAITPNMYYFCKDSNTLYKDGDTNRYRLGVELVNTELDRVHNIRPNNGTQYYILETNELWIYNAGWILIDGETRESNGYYYNANHLYPSDDITEVLDNNGLLADGSVCVRDLNRIIKGKMYINQLTNNLVISSFVGGGIDFLPSGELDKQGNLKLFGANTYTGEFDENGDPIKTANKGLMKFFGDIILVDEDGRQYKVVTTPYESNN